MIARRTSIIGRARGALASAALLISVSGAALSCGDDEAVDAEAEAPAAAGGGGQAAEPPGDEVVAAKDPAPAEPDKPLLGIRAYAANVYKKPDDGASRLGYLRVGAVVPRAPEPAGKRGCKGGWYQIEPEGYVCAGEDATTDLDDPLLRAAAKRPNRDKPLPYRYGFVRSVLPLYLRVPSSQQQFKSEFKLEEHLEWYKEHKDEVQTVAALGAADIAVDQAGRAVKGKRLGELGTERNSNELSLGQLFGGDSDDDPWPFWLRDDRRLIPNISGFDVPEYAVFADRARRHTGLAFVGSFKTGDHHLGRRFAITTDLRLAPTSKVKPDAASPWHGVELGDDLTLPIAFVSRRGAQRYAIDGDSARPKGDAGRRSVHRLSGKVKKVDGEKYYLTDGGDWLRSAEVGIAVAPSKPPSFAKKGEKWIEIDLSEQTLVLWEGTTPVFATLVSTGRPTLGDPETTTATPRGIFRIYSKHISATMDSDEGSGARLNQEKALKPGDDGYVPEKGDGVYGKTLRRGHGLFKLRDVPYIQYFERNYAIHGAYWHDVFGISRSHGCVNLSPADALRVFKWTTPVVPDEWHGVRSDGGTRVVIHK